jgi:hypothetical protein
VAPGPTAPAPTPALVAPAVPAPDAVAPTTTGPGKIIKVKKAKVRARSAKVKWQHEPATEEMTGTKFQHRVTWKGQGKKSKKWNTSKTTTRNGWHITKVKRLPANTKCMVHVRANHETGTSNVAKVKFRTKKKK